MGTRWRTADVYNFFNVKSPVRRHRALDLLWRYYLAFPLLFTSMFTLLLT